jgi:hypothetical protein
MIIMIIMIMIIIEHQKLSGNIFLTDVHSCRNLLYTENVSDM